MNVSHFDCPWNAPNAALLIDPYHGNSIDWAALSTERRVVAIIHKATAGTSDIDPAYLARRQEAKRRGYLWGSYHYGIAGNPEQQADHYIATVAAAPDELLALDLEDATSEKLMNVDEALVFVRRIKQRVGRYPLLYANHSSTCLISARYQGTEFVNTPLWYARFKAVVTDFPTAVWPTYTLWQFSSELKPQIVIPGAKPDMDVNVFNGSIESLRASWPLS